MAQIRPLVYVSGDIQAIQTGDTLDPAFLGTGTRDGSRYLRDDGTWATVSGGGGVTTVINARVASTANVTISSAPAAIDGVTLASGDVVLLKNQTTGAENGAYDFNGTGAAMTRNTNMSGGSSVRAGLLVTVSEGTVNYDSLWMLTSNGLQTVGTNALVFSTSVPSYTELTLDFGTGPNTYSKQFSVSVAGLLAGTRVDIIPSGYTPAGVYFDEAEFEAITYVGKCVVNGTLLVIANSSSAVRGQRIAQVTIRS